MYKKILVLVIGLSFIMRAVPMSVYFIGGRHSLPLAVLAFSVLMVVFAGYLIAKLFIKGIGLKEIIAYFSLDFISVLFNLVFSAFFASVGSTDIIDILLVGNVLVLVVNPILIYFAIKKDKYISIPNKVVENAPNQKVNAEFEKEDPTSKDQKVKPQPKENFSQENEEDKKSNNTNNSEDKTSSSQKKKNNSNKKKSKKGKKNK